MKSKEEFLNELHYPPVTKLISRLCNGDLNSVERSFYTVGEILEMHCLLDFGELAVQFLLS